LGSVLPGFIDMHVHVLMRDAGSYRADIVGETGPDAVLRSATTARKLLLAGFTTIRDMAQLHLTPDLLAVSLARASDARSMASPTAWMRWSRPCGCGLGPSED
jgi:imidazolonepropionase-like amidohydrolase